MEDLGRLEDSKALAEYLLKALDRGNVSKCVSLAMKLEGNARLSRSYMTNGDVVVLLVVPRRVTKKGSGDLLDVVNFRDALEEATLEMRLTAIQTYRRLLRSRVNPGLVPMTTGLMDELNPRVKPVQGACVWKDGSNPLPTTFKEDKTKAHREMEKIRANPARFNAAHEKKVQDTLLRAKT